MKILLIAGNGFIGSYVAREAIRRGEAVAVLHRGTSSNPLPEGANEILGDRNRLSDLGPDLHRFRADIVIDFGLSSERQAKALMDTFRGSACRVVALSSGDVYRACAILNGTESGPILPTPLTEESELRRTGQVYPPESIHMLRQIFGWLDDTYDKIPVERTVWNDAELPGTVLRLPMVYGPGDYLHRLFPYLKRMDDGRPAVLLQEEFMNWRAPRAYVENVAAAIVLAASSPEAAGRIYNVSEAESCSEAEWVLKIGRVAGWRGSVISVPAAEAPAHIRFPSKIAQNFDMSSARIRAELRFREPIDERLALERTIEWERSHPPRQIQPNQFDYAAEDAALARLRAARQ